MELYPRRRLAAGALIGLVVVPLLGGCGESTVRISFRPAAGQRYSYRITVQATTVTTVADEPPRRTRTDTVFLAEQRVLAPTPSGGRVEVRLREQGGATQTFVVRLDRAAAVAEVQSIEGLPAQVLGQLGLSEIFPAAAAAPPDRALAPGERWTIDRPVQIAQPPASRLQGSGRLVSLGRVDGFDVARVTSRYRLPVSQPVSPAENRPALAGTQTTAAEVTYAVEDGSVLSAKASTRGTFDLTLFPPPATAGSPIPGTLNIVVTSTTRRINLP